MHARLALCPFWTHIFRFRIDFREGARAGASPRLPAPALNPSPRSSDQVAPADPDHLILILLPPSMNINRRAHGGWRHGGILKLILRPVHTINRGNTLRVWRAMGKCRKEMRGRVPLFEFRLSTRLAACRFFPLPTALPAAAASLIPPSDLSDLPQLWSLARSSPTARSVSLSGSISVSASVPVLDTLCTHSSASSPSPSPAHQAPHPQL
ncbi:hypothetical protein B0H11DRAFT_2248569 [Mycena galericulata]|nr:hypothetical protein B0H11DRAFT_2248569 [Mycena galericulata]